MNLSNKYMFWSIVTIVLALFITFISYKTAYIDVKKQSDITERSYENDQEYVLDLEKMDTVSDLDGNKENITNTALNSLLNNLYSPNNLLLIIYTILISILFLYREKQNKKTIALLEKRDDELKILAAKHNSTTIYRNLGSVRNSVSIQ